MQAGGFDRLLLESLYEDSTRSQQIAGAYSSGGLDANPSDYNDPFAVSNSIAPPPSVQMALMAQQQQQQQQQYYYYQQQPLQQEQYYQQQDTSMMVPNQPQQAQQQMASANPFGDPFAGFPQGATTQSNQHLL